MGNWNEILAEINKSHDQVRRDYLKRLHERSGRNIVCYYSGWLQKTGQQFYNVVNITDEDKSGFMSCFHGLKKEAGLDLVIHSPGGGVTATESIVHYFRSIFGNDIRVFVPQLAMSGGTIMALSGKEIWMGKHSNLGPIDPQFGGMPAVTLIEEVERAYNEIKNDPSRAAIWAPILSKIAPTLLTQAQQAIDLSRQIAINALMDGMLKTRKNAKKIAEGIAAELTNTRDHKEHSRHIHPEDCKKIGLRIRMLEDDNELQDAVLSVHHAFMITLANTPAAKIIENHHGGAFIKNIQPSIVAIPQP